MFERDHREREGWSNAGCSTTPTGLIGANKSERVYIVAVAVVPKVEQVVGVAEVDIVGAVVTALFSKPEDTEEEVKEVPDIGDE